MQVVSHETTTTKSLMAPKHRKNIGKISGREAVARATRRVDGGWGCARALSRARALAPWSARQIAPDRAPKPALHAFWCAFAPFPTAFRPLFRQIPPQLSDRTVYGGILRHQNRLVLADPASVSIFPRLFETPPRPSPVHGPTAARTKNARISEPNVLCSSSIGLPYSFPLLIVVVEDGAIQPTTKPGMPELLD